MSIPHSAKSRALAWLASGSLSVTSARAQDESALASIGPYVNAVRAFYGAGYTERSLSVTLAPGVFAPPEHTIKARVASADGDLVLSEAISFRNGTAYRDDSTAAGVHASPAFAAFVASTGAFDIVRVSCRPCHR